MVYAEITWSESRWGALQKAGCIGWMGVGGGAAAAGGGSEW